MDSYIGRLLDNRYEIIEIIGTGGMATKIQAAKISTEGGIDMVIANGSYPSLLYDIVEGKSIGTKFLGRK